MLKYWDKLSRPPVSALKEIQAGRLKGKSDINPQWRLKAMTETFGPIGIGWSYAIQKLWTEKTDNGEVCAFAEITMQICVDGKWSAPFPGIGGSMLVANEKNGPHTSDEAYKMAITDALSVAMKQLGVAAEVYLGNWDGSKYRDAPAPAVQPASVKPPAQHQTAQALGGVILCSTCGGPLASTPDMEAKTVAWCNSKYSGKMLCRRCQPKL